MTAIHFMYKHPVSPPTKDQFNALKTSAEAACYEAASRNKEFKFCANIADLHCTGVAWCWDGINEIGWWKVDISEASPEDGDLRIFIRQYILHDTGIQVDEITTEW